MGRKILLSGLIVALTCGMSALPTSASTPKPTIKYFTPSSGLVGSEVTIKGTNLAGATKVTFKATIATVISDTSTKIEVDVPAGATTGRIKVTTRGGKAMIADKFVVLDSSATTTTAANSGTGLGDGNSASAVMSGNATYGSPTGTVIFYACGPSASPQPCTSKASQVGSPMVLTAGANDTSSASSVSFTASAVGYWCFAAYYSGNANYAPSSDTSSDSCFDVTTGTAISATTTTAASPDTGLGVANSASAVVSGNATYGSPTGTVTFYACGPSASPQSCTSEASPVGSPVKLTAGVSDASSASPVSFTASAVGYWCFAAYYSGDANYAPSSDTSNGACFDVTTGTALSATTATAVSSGIRYLDDDSASAVVSGNATFGSPTGTVVFYTCGPSASPQACTSEASPVGSPVEVTAGANDSSSVSSASFRASAVGYWCFTAYYSGDTNYAPSSDTSSDACFDVTATSISNVEISNNVDDPTVTISGTGFGTSADLQSTRLPCYDTGLDYLQFSFDDTTDNWSAGGINPSYDCVGIVIQSYSNSQVVFTFGAGYGSFKIGNRGVMFLDSGDQFTVTLVGASFSGTAEYTPQARPSQTSGSANA